MAKRRRDEVMPLSEFPQWKQDRIAEQVASPTPPPKWIDFGLCQLPSRAWHEWYWQRGRPVPDEKQGRPKIPYRVRRAVFERDGDTCQICYGVVPDGDAHLDHIVPWSQGGPDTIDNLRVTHSRCNIKRGAPIAYQVDQT